ncbi:hypothetical protein [Brevundimonas sp.]|uniref:hypothetical protein n=1 Tax=Brevundimonas sp. TaxID=1871086 RepID=UPI002C679E56|nr:hypothetical protein [Brevundimonas sp.]HWQ86090.1 hypothetical protein [Brevundimonas sp.]
MTIRHTLTAVAALGALVFGAAACTPADNDAADADTTGTRTVVETREVPAAPVIIEREVQSPPVVIERDRRDGDSTTVRAGRDGIEVETTNR